MESQLVRNFSTTDSVRRNISLGCFFSTDLSISSFRSAFSILQWNRESKIDFFLCALWFSRLDFESVTDARRPCSSTSGDRSEVPLANNPKLMSLLHNLNMDCFLWQEQQHLLGCVFHFIHENNHQQ